MSFFDEVADAAEASNRQTNISYEPDFYDLPNASGVFGREAGADYARYLFPSLEIFIRSESERKAYEMIFSPQVIGPGAREGFADELKSLLQGFAIDWRGGSIQISWRRLADK